MKILFASIILAFSTTAALADNPRYGTPYWEHHSVYGHRGGHHNHYNNYYRRHHNGHHRRSDNDDWAWAVGGLILGTIIANGQQQTQTQVTLPPPQRRVQTCYDEVAYDSNGTPYVARKCVETVQ